MARDFSEAILKLWEDGTIMSLEDEWLTPPDGQMSAQST